MLPIIRTIRPNAPIAWPVSTAPTFNIARHHILPYNTLWDGWNLLVNSFVDTQLAEARVALRQYLMLCNRNLPDVEALLDRLRNGRLTVVDCNTLQETAVWPAWNIVDGPKNRSDDPQDRSLDRFTFGVTPEEFSRMAAIERLYGSLGRFNALAPGAVSLQTLADSLYVARDILAFVDRPIPFRPEMWERDADGRWHKRRSGEQFLKAAAR